jgi:sulfur-oxidizing protein SoxY
MKPLNPAIFLKAVLVMALFIAMPLRAEPDTKLWPIMKEAFFAKRDMQEADFIKIDAPRRFC